MCQLRYGTENRMHKPGGSGAPGRPAAVNLNAVHSERTVDACRAGQAVASRRAPQHTASPTPPGNLAVRVPCYSVPGPNHQGVPQSQWAGPKGQGPGRHCRAVRGMPRYTTYGYPQPPLDPGRQPWH